MSETLGDLTREKLHDLLLHLASEEYGQLSPADFFHGLAALDAVAPGDIELTGKVENGQLIFLQPAPLPVEGNTIHFGQQRVIIHLAS